MAENVATREVSLYEFVSELREAHTAAMAADGSPDFEELRNKFARLGVTGRETRDDIQRSIVFPDSMPEDEEDQVQIHRYYDSILGTSPHLPYKVPLQLHILSQPAQQLNSDTHIEVDYTLVQDQMANLTVLAHEIPHMSFASFGDLHGLVRVMFPRLPTDSGSNKVPECYRELWYKHGVLPALKTLRLCPNGLFPTSYSEAYFNSHDSAGKFTPPTLSVEPACLDYLIPALKDRVDQDYSLKWAKGFFFLHQVQGIKRLTHHETYDDEGRAVYHQLMTQYFDSDTLIPHLPNFYIDVGLEFYAPNRSLFWKRSSHAAMLIHLFPNMDANIIRQIAQGGEGFSRNCMPLISHLSGCSWTLGDLAADGPVYHVRLYSTEKDPTGNSEKEPVIHMDALDAMKGTKLAKRQILAMERAMSSHKAAGTSSVARLEVRTVISSADTVLQDMPIETLLPLLECINARLIWSFKFLTLMSFKSILKLLWTSNGRARTLQLSVALHAGIVWRINALSSPAATGPAIHALHKSTLPLTYNTSHPHIVSRYDANPHDPAPHCSDGSSDYDSDEEEDGESEPNSDFKAPIAHWGSYFMRDFRLPGDAGSPPAAPRMNRQHNGIAAPLLPYRTFKELAGMAPGEMMHEFGQPLNSFSGNQYPLIHRMKRPDRILDYPEPPVDGFKRLVRLHSDLVTGFRSDEDQGSDLEEEDRTAPGFGDPRERGIQHCVTLILHCFMDQILILIPPPALQNPTGLQFFHRARDAQRTRDERQGRLFNWTHLDLFVAGFTAIQTHNPLKDDWENAFQRLLPSKERITRENVFEKRKNPRAGLPLVYKGPCGAYKQCSYLDDWCRVMEGSTASAAAIIRDCVKKEFFDRLLWVPAVTESQMWSSSTTPRFDSIWGPTSPVPGHGAPQIFINPSYTHSVMWAGEYMFRRSR